MTRSKLARVLSATAALCSLAPFSRATDWIVAPSGGDFTAIQPAVNAAAPDDLILVRAGTYTGNVTLDGKPLWLVADTPPGTVIVDGTLTVKNLAANEIAVLVGLDVRGQTEDFSPGQPGLHLLDNAGEVRVQASILSGGDSFLEEFAATTPAPGARIQNCARVTLSDSVFRGGEGAAESPNPVGADGVSETTSSVAAWGCEFRGGNGGSNGFSGPFGEPSAGGAGFRASSFGVFAAGCLFQGGAGGHEDDICVYTGADGGDGLILPAMGSQARLMSSTLAGGAGGHSCSFDPDGDPGAPFSGGGTPITVAGDARFLEGPGVVTDGAAFALTVQGSDGDLAYLRLGTASRYQFKPWRKGFDLVDVDYLIDEPLLVPPSGTVATSYTLDGWHTSGERTRLFGQAYVVASSGEIVLGGPLSLVVEP